MDTDKLTEMESLNVSLNFLHLGSIPYHSFFDYWGVKTGKSLLTDFSSYFGIKVFGV